MYARMCLILAIVFITGCSNQQLSNLAIEREVYCDATANSIDKELAIAAIRQEIPGYPINGICTDFGGEYLEATAKFRQRLTEERDERIRERLESQSQ